MQIPLRSLIRSISLELYVNEYRTRRSYSRRVLFFYFSMYETFYIVDCLYAGHRSTIKNMFLLNLSKSIIVYYFLKVRNLYKVSSKCCYRIKENLLISLISDLKRSTGKNATSIKISTIGINFETTFLSTKKDIDNNFRILKSFMSEKSSFIF